MVGKDLRNGGPLEKLTIAKLMKNFIASVFEFYVFI